ncbi:A-kinase anchor protein 1, mitochondrial-like isoform X3 [Penaeus chinensis]|uniref:A-kinase anchor protein 1, mitochondrial-like isoform X3 n=1 Tax=Penaeus chinensis TaxID=139456 RepID=UPI001FB6271C|nr:A-kinase anchor protein 1, mitochondrial-like isoform X3 [Penaeus chinensis]
MYFLWGMKVALGAAAAITGASALIYIILRSRKCHTQQGGKDVSSPRHKVGTLTEVSSHEKSDVHVGGETEPHRESKDHQEKNNYVSYKSLNGHVPAEENSDLSPDDFAPRSEGSFDGEKQKTSQEVNSDKCVPPEDIASITTNETQDNCKESTVKIDVLTSCIVTLNAPSCLGDECQLDEKERSLPVKDEVVLKADKDEIDGSLVIPSKENEVVQSLESAKADTAEAPGSSPNSTLESSIINRPEDGSSCEKEAAQACQQEDNYSTDRDMQEDIVQVTKMYLREALPEDQDVPRISEGEVDKSDTPPSTNIETQIIASALCVDETVNCNDAGKVQKSESSLSNTQNEEILNEVKEETKEELTLTLPASALEKIKTVAVMEGKPELETEASNQKESNVDVSSSNGDAISSETTKIDSCEEEVVVEKRELDCLEEENKLEQDDGIQQDISLVEAESVVIQEASTNPSVIQENHIDEAVLVNGIEMSDNATSVQKNVDVKAEVIPNVTSEVIPNVTSEVIANMTTEVIPNVTAEVIANMTTEVIPNVTAEVIANMTTEVIPNVTAEVIANMTTEVIPNVTAEVIANMTTEVIPNVTADVIANMTTEVIPNVTAEVIPNVTAEVIPAVDTVPDCNDKQILNWAAEVQEEIAREKAELHTTELEPKHPVCKVQVSEAPSKSTEQKSNKKNSAVSSSKEGSKQGSTKKPAKEASEKGRRRRGGKQAPPRSEVPPEPKTTNNVSQTKENSQTVGVEPAVTDLETYPVSETDSHNCDSQSLKSIDSGQGSIEVEPETVFNPSACPVFNQEQFLFFEFEIPQTLVGRLIGKKGAFVNKIKATTDATLIVYPHKNRRLKLCSVEGTKQQVDAAIRMIREHFPLDRYPDVTLEPVSGRGPVPPATQPTVNTQAMQIELTAGVVVEVRVSSVMSGGELWVQQPLHPSFSALQRLHSCMNLNYGDGLNTPPLPVPIQEGTVCVSHVAKQWMRSQVLSCTEESAMVVLLDVGGVLNLPTSDLRQIRYDYMTLPFQASQCLLHGIQPVGEDGWDDTSAAVLEELVSGTILFTTVVSYTEDGVPLVNLYRRQQDQYINLNEKMVHLGHAKWIAPPSAS